MISIATLIGEPEMVTSLAKCAGLWMGHNSDGNPVNTVKAAFAEVHKPSDFQAFKRKALGSYSIKPVTI